MLYYLSLALLGVTLVTLYMFIKILLNGSILIGEPNIYILWSEILLLVSFIALASMGIYKGLKRVK